MTSIDDEPSCNDRARDGLQHLQAAARELIQAARAMLDVADDLIDDPAAVATLAGAVGVLGDVVRRRAGGDPDATDANGDANGDTGTRGDPATRIERITVA